MLSKDMEGVAKQELNSRLGQRRSVPPDSTAGVSLSGLTDANYTGGGTQGDLVRAQATAVPERELSPITPSPQPIETIDLSPQDEDSYRAPAETSLLWTTNSSPKMVFHVMRAGDAKKQDIVALTDIMDPVTGSPSWSRFTEILASGGDLGVGFRVREEFLVVNERIYIASERQFLACIQYLRNSAVLNSEILVHSYAECRISSPGPTSAAACNAAATA